MNALWIAIFIQWAFMGGGCVLFWWQNKRIEKQIRLMDKLMVSSLQALDVESTRMSKELRTQAAGLMRAMDDAVEVTFKRREARKP